MYNNKYLNSLIKDEVYGHKKLPFFFFDRIDNICLNTIALNQTNK